MPFRPRHFNQILADMIAYVEANTVLTDWTPGSVARTLLEAAALEDDEQYFQMVQLLDAFRLTTARGEDLDRRLADFGLIRREATRATCRVRFFDPNLTTEQLSSDATSGSSSIRVFDSSVFPITGFPYTVRIGEGTASVQDLSVTANDTATGTLTLSSTLNDDHSVGDRVSLVSGASSRSVNTSTVIQTPPTATQSPKTFITQEPAFIVAGNFFSNEVLVQAQSTGPGSNVSANRLVQFAGSPPFAGAGVINLVPASGGALRESDAQFRTRALRVLQSLSRGTPLAVRTAAVGVTDPATGQRAVSANIIEDFENNEVLVYIDDGTGLTPDTLTLPSSSIDNGGSPLSVGSATVPVDDSSAFPSSGHLLLEDDGVNPSELVAFVSKDDATNTLILGSPTTALHADGATVLTVDIITDNSEPGRSRFRFQNYPVVRGTDRIFYDPGSGIEELATSRYTLNKGNGEFQLSSLSGAATGSTLFAHYTYYTNLIREVQRTLEGDIDNANRYPGVKAAGVFLSVEAPLLRRVSVVASISAQEGFREEDLVSSVRGRIENYISSLGIGDNVVVSKIIDEAHNVRGVRDITITLPSSNVTVLENELPVPFDSTGDSLITIL